MNTTYDTIVVGAGAAGAVIAARLTEDPRRSVLLLEAGPDFPDIEQLPEEIRYGYGRGAEMWSKAFGRDSVYGWGYSGRATDRNPDMFVPRGRIVGGSTAVNAQVFLRGLPEDYDAWASEGNDEWSYEKLLPYFERNEADPLHGTSSPIPVRRHTHDELNADQRAFYHAALKAGFPETDDHNAPDSTGVGFIPLNNRDGVRWSTAICYLAPARQRANLTVQGNCFVRRVLFEGTRAVGVQVEAAEGAREFHAGEVVLCGGAIGSPHLLMLSGVGPADQLRDVGVPLVHDVPGIGQNLRDHPYAPVSLQANREYRVDETDPRVQVGLYVTAEGSDLRNDIFIVAVSGATAGGFYTTERAVIRGFDIQCHLYLAVGAGEIRLQSTDPHVQPVLDYNFLAEEFDRKRLRDGIRLIIDLLEHSDFQKLIEDRIAPADADLASDSALDAWLMGVVRTTHHVSATCKMGPASDPTGVVDQYCSVHGLEDLRVADASIMPNCIRANANVTAMVIGERVADFLA